MGGMVLVMKESMLGKVYVVYTTNNYDSPCSTVKTIFDNEQDAKDYIRLQTNDWFGFYTGERPNYTLTYEEYKIEKLTDERYTQIKIDKNGIANWKEVMKFHSPRYSWTMSGAPSLILTIKSDPTNKAHVVYKFLIDNKLWLCVSEILDELVERFKLNE